MILSTVFPTFQFDNDYMEFRNQIENLRAMLQNFMDTWFAKSLTVSRLIQCILFQLHCSWSGRIIFIIHYEPSYLDLQCLQFQLLIVLFGALKVKIILVLSFL